MHISIFDNVGIEFFFTKRMVLFYVKWTWSHIIRINYIFTYILFDSATWFRAMDERKKYFYKVKFGRHLIIIIHVDMRWCIIKSVILVI